MIKGIGTEITYVSLGTLFELLNDMLDCAKTSEIPPEDISLSIHGSRLRVMGRSHGNLTYLGEIDFRDGWWKKEVYDN